MKRKPQIITGSSQGHGTNQGKGVYYVAQGERVDDLKIFLSRARKKVIRAEGEVVEGGSKRGSTVLHGQADDLVGGGDQREQGGKNHPFISGPRRGNLNKQRLLKNKPHQEQWG